MVAFFARWKHLLLVLVYPIVGLGFAFCESAVTHATFVMEWPGVDQSIPFVPWMVWPYVAWYGLVAFPFFWLGWKGGPEFTRFCWFIYLGMSLAYVVYLFFPNGQMLRPGLEALPSGWDGQVLRWLYSHDTPYNVNPSIHVIDTLGVWIALGRDKVLNRKKWFGPLLAIVCLAIIASTVLVKQHSILDVFGGLAMAGLVWLILYILPRFFFSIRRG